MTASGKSNFERLLECLSPRVPIRYYIQARGSSSSSAASGGKAEQEEEEVRKPRIVLEDIWTACEEWSSFGIEVPLEVNEDFNKEVNQHYVPSLSAIQIFTIKPVAHDPRSSAIGIDGKETGAAKPESFGNYKHRFLSADHLGYLYYQYNETTRPFERSPLTIRITELAKQYTGLSTLTSSDLSPYSWISIAWYPIYPIPAVSRRTNISGSFLTYHSLLPNFPETIGKKDDKREEEGESSEPEVELPPFAAATYKAYGNVWIRPGTSDRQKVETRENFASSWLETMGFFHSDFNFFMSRKYYGGPR